MNWMETLLIKLVAEVNGMTIFYPMVKLLKELLNHFRQYSIFLRHILLPIYQDHPLSKRGLNP